MVLRLFIFVLVFMMNLCLKLGYLSIGEDVSFCFRVLNVLLYFFVYDFGMEICFIFFFFVDFFLLDVSLCKGFVILEKFFIKWW